LIGVTMLSFYEYRMTKILESIDYQNLDAALDGTFELLRLELLQAIEVPSMLLEGWQADDLHREAAEIALKLTAQEDYYNCNLIIGLFIQECRREVKRIVTESLDDDDETGAYFGKSEQIIGDIKASIRREITKQVAKLKQMIVGGITSDRSNQQGADQGQEQGHEPESAPTVGTTQNRGSMGRPAPMGSGNASLYGNQPTGGATAAPEMPDASGVAANRKPRNGMWGWLRNLFSPTAWSRWWKGRQRMNKVRDLFGDDEHPYSKFVDKMHGQQFQAEVFKPVVDLIEAAWDGQAVTLGPIIDKFGEDLLRNVNFYVDTLAGKLKGSNGLPPVTYTSRSSRPKSVEGEPVATSARSASPAEVEPVAAPTNPDFATVPVDFKDTPPVAPKAPVSAGQPVGTNGDYRDLSVEMLLKSPGRSTLKQVLRSGISFSDLVELAKSGKGFEKLSGWALKLRMPPEMITVDNHVKVISYLKNAFQHLGALKPSEGGPNSEITPKDEPVATKPQVTPTPTAVAEPAAQPEISDHEQYKHNKGLVYDKVTSLLPDVSPDTVDDAIDAYVNAKGPIKHDQVDAVAAEIGKHVGGSAGTLPDTMTMPTTARSSEPQAPTAPEKEVPTSEPEEKTVRNEPEVSAIPDVGEPPTPEPEEDFGRPTTGGYTSGDDPDEGESEDKLADKFLAKLISHFPGEWNDEWDQHAVDIFKEKVRKDPKNADIIMNNLKDFAPQFVAKIKKKLEDENWKVTSGSRKHNIEDSVTTVGNLLVEYGFQPSISQDNILRILEGASIGDKVSNEDLVLYVVRQLAEEGVRMVRNG